MDQAHDASDPQTSKRKRSASIDSSSHLLIPNKIPRLSVSPNHLQINYLVRQNPNDLPLITSDDSLASVLAIISDYQGVIERHESLACNLGARPLGPILIKRFERLFEEPPKVLKAHTSKDGNPVNVTWLDVVEFARSKPEQFTLGQMSEGVRVCQFYTKQCRVQISEEDFLLIGSGMPQKLIPPQPIAEDEEKELGTLDIVERHVDHICRLADQVAARARQLNHRLRGRKQAIIERRASEPAISGAVALRASSPSNVALMNGITPGTSAPLSPSGFMAVNSRHAAEALALNEQSPSNGYIPDPTTISQNTREELVKNFFTLSDLRANGNEISWNDPIKANHLANGYVGSPVIPSPTRPSQISSKSARQSHVGRSATTYEDQQLAASLLSYNPDSHYPISLPAPNTPITLLQAQTQSRASPAERDDGGPFRTVMVGLLETLTKGDRIIPPCDRCRRLHMDCLKNLTACIGCTKKHAKCSWRDVREDELHGPELQQLNGLPRDFVADEDVNMLDGQFVTGDEQQSNQQQEQESDYAHAHKYPKHDDEMQAAHSLAMAAVADAATQVQLLMQRDNSVNAPEITNVVSIETGSPNVGVVNTGKPHSVMAGNGKKATRRSNVDHSNVDPGLQSYDVNSIPKEMVGGGS